jgi:inner membrane protein involved in colicin E2 resistance
MPHKINPGPLASRMSYFAPVSLLFFFTVLVILGAVKGTHLHPMHYFFLGASFFAFHLLFAYLVDHVVAELAFVIAAVVSLTLVISYLWRVVGARFALREAGLSQLLFLVLFSYAFFFEGYTGLVVTIGAIVTLAVLMQVTARVDWNEVFRKKKVSGEQ